MLPLTEIETLELHDADAALRRLLQPLHADGQRASPAGRRYTTGNRCEKGAGNTDAHEKARRPCSPISASGFLRYPPLAAEAAPRGELGIPRVLNMYENYPFWATFFKAARLPRDPLAASPTAGSMSCGMESIPSESECYPAKLAHGHVQWLIDQGREDDLSSLRVL